MICAWMNMVSSQIGSMPIFYGKQCIITLLGRNNFWVTRAADSLCAFDHSNVSVSDRNSPPCSTEQVIMGSKPFWNFIWKIKKLSITGMLLKKYKYYRETEWWAAHFCSFWPHCAATIVKPLFTCRVTSGLVESRNEGAKNKRGILTHSEPKLRIQY